MRALAGGSNTLKLDKCCHLLFSLKTLPKTKAIYLLYPYTSAPLPAQAVENEDLKPE